MSAAAVEFCARAGVVVLGLVTLWGAWRATEKSRTWRVIATLTIGVACFAPFGFDAPSKGTEAIPAPAPGAPPPSPPPCIHETVRPGFLQCVGKEIGHQEYLCTRWEIVYEKVCDTWGPRPATDGGAK